MPSDSLRDLHDRIQHLSCPFQEIAEIATILDLIVRELSAIEARLNEAQAAARQASNVASCLANGIKPD